MSAMNFEACFWLSLFVAPLGAFLIFRRLSFFGDALSHATLGGVGVAFLFLPSSPIVMSLGAIGSVLTTAGLLNFFEKRFRLPSDVALTAAYFGMFVLGMLLLEEGGHHVEEVFFGDFASLSLRGLWFLRAVGALGIAILLVGWKYFWIFVIDRQFARVMGLERAWVDLTLLCLTAVAVVSMIQAVGVVLVAAYLVLPAAAALAWAKTLKQYIVISVMIAFFASSIGLWAQEKFELERPGEAIALCAVILFLLSHSIARLTLRTARRIH